MADVVDVTTAVAAVLEARRVRRSAARSAGLPFQPSVAATVASGGAAGLGGFVTTLPRPANRGDSSAPGQPVGRNRAGNRALHAAHRQRSSHDRLTPAQRRHAAADRARLERHEARRARGRRSRVEDRTPEERREKARSGRAERWYRRHQLREVTDLKNVKYCGVGHIPGYTDSDGKRRRYDSDGDPVSQSTTLRVKTNPDGSRTAGYGGLQHCGSVWACPVCSATIATTRARDIARVLRWALDQKYSASMMTLTLRHFKGQKLRDVWNAVSKGWAAATGGKRWMSEQDQYGLEGWIKAVEATHGANGWHVHLHVLMIWNQPDGEAVQSDAQELADAMHRRWTAAVQRAGFDSIRDSGGLDVRMASLDPDSNGLHQYFTKMAFEISGGYSKEAKGKGRAPFQVLNDFFATGLVDDLDIWHEWEAGSRRRRQIAWSEGIRDRAGLEEEVSDEDAANAEMAADEAIKLHPKTDAALACAPWLACELLEVAEDGGLDAACEWLDRHGLMWHSRHHVAAPVKAAPV